MIRVFCDFDGTVATEDVGERLFLKFTDGRSADIVTRYVNGEISSHECLQQECEAVGPIALDELISFVDSFELDPFFGGFVRFCSAREIDLTIVSDGLDFYIDRLLRRDGVSHVRYFANHLELTESDEGTMLVPSFPFQDAECPDCGNCKRNHLVTRSGDDDLIVYVGDGHSDRCPVQYADIVFAKRSLITHCQRQNITYHAFAHFGDVQFRMENIAERRRIKKRREAVMARRGLFMQG